MPLSRSAFLVKTLQQRAPSYTLNGLKRMRIEYSRTGGDQAATRQFIKQELPVFKYANPNLQVLQTPYRDAKFQAQLHVMFENSETETTIPAAEKTHAELTKAIKEAHTRANAYTGATAE